MDRIDKIEAWIENMIKEECEWREGIEQRLCALEQRLYNLEPADVLTDLTKNRFNGILTS